jgi:hypothetical protein
MPRRQSVRPAGELGINAMQTNGAAVQVWMRSYKADGRYPYIPCATLAEERLVLFLEYHPEIAYIQRADVPQSFLDANRLVARIPVPIVIPYDFDGSTRDYYPDFVCLTKGGRMVIGEAGLASRKAQPEGVAKAGAATRFVAITDGEYWIGTETTISDQRYTNLQLLHAHRGPIEPDLHLVRQISEAWAARPMSIRALSDALKLSFTADEIEATSWHLVAKAAAAGRLDNDLDAARLNLDTPITLIGPMSDEVLVPPALPSSPPEGESAMTALIETGAGHVIDPESIADPRRRAQFFRNLAAWRSFQTGNTVAEVARHDGRSADTLGPLFARVADMGEPALVPYTHKQRDDPIERAFSNLIGKMLRRKKKYTAVEISDSPELRALARKLTKEHERVITAPTLNTVRRLIREQKDGGALFDRAEHGRRPRRTPSGGMAYMSRMGSVAMLCEVDEHYVDLLITTVEGYEIATRLYAAILIDVKSGCPLAGILSPTRLAEEDYMRLVKMAIEPKDGIQARYGLINEWPCTAKPGAIASDRGLIFTSQRARDVLVGRLNVRERIMPPEAPSAKGTVEAFFGSLTRRLMQRLPGTTMGSPEARDSYDSTAAALKAGVTFEEAEEYFYRWIVDVYLQDWDDLRGKRRIDAWHDAVAADGLPRFVGHPDELKLLLLKRFNRRTEDGTFPVHSSNGVSFLGMWYRAGSENLAKRIRGKNVEIFYDRRDIVTIYVALEGQIVGHLTSRNLAGLGRISEWEWRAIRRGKKPMRDEAVATSLTNARSILDDASRSKKDRTVAARAEARSRLYDRDLAEIHPAEILAERARISREGPPEPEPIELGPKVGPNTPVPIRPPRVIQLRPRA